MTVFLSYFSLGRRGKMCIWVGDGLQDRSSRKRISRGMTDEERGEL